LTIPKELPNNSPKIPKKFKNSQRIPKEFPKNSQKIPQKNPIEFPQNSQNIQFPTSHLEAENPFGLVLNLILNSK